MRAVAGLAVLVAGLVALSASASVSGILIDDLNDANVAG